MDFDKCQIDRAVEYVFWSNSFSYSELTKNQQAEEVRCDRIITKACRFSSDFSSWYDREFRHRWARGFVP